jgi:hypothetical protein
MAASLQQPSAICEDAMSFEQTLAPKSPHEPVSLLRLEKNHTKHHNAMPPQPPNEKYARPYIEPGRVLGTFLQEITKYGIMSQTIHPLSTRLKPYIAPGRVLGTFEEERNRYGPTSQTVHPFSTRLKSNEPIANIRSLSW